MTSPSFNCSGIRTIYYKPSTYAYLKKNDPLVAKGIVSNNEACPNSPEQK